MNKRLVGFAFTLLFVAALALPQVFDYEAARADGTFGDTSVHSLSSTNSGVIDAYKATLSTACNVTSMSLYLNSHSDSYQVQMAIYSDISGSPATLLAQTASVVATTGWNTLSIGPLSLSTGTYWLALQLSGSDAFAYDAGSSSSNNVYRTYTYGTFPSSFGTASAGDWYGSIYASYTSSGVTPTPTPTVSPTPTPTPTLTPTPTPGPNPATIVGTLTLKSTFNCISVYANFSGDTNSSNSATLQYKATSSSTWINGMALVADRRTQIREYGATNDLIINPFYSQWRGSIIGLIQNTSYDVRVTFTDADGVSGTNPTTGTISTRNETISLGTGSTYYVATTGSNGNTGTIGSPWLTIDYGVGRLSAGDTLYIRGGTYTYSGTSGTSRTGLSGTSSNWITVSNYGSETVTINGSNSGSQALISFANCNYIRVHGLTIRNVGGTPMILINCTNFVVEYCDISCQSTSAGMIQLSSNSGDFVVVRNNTLTRNYAEIEDCSGIYMTGGSYSGVRGGIIICDNAADGGTNYGMWDFISSGGGHVENGLYADSDVYGNVIQSTGDDGLELDGAGCNVRCWDNTITQMAGSNTFISMSAVIIGPEYVFHNIGIGSLSSEYPRNAYIKTGAASGSWTTNPPDGWGFVYNNTFSAYTDEGWAPIGDLGYVPNQVVKNNIFYGTDKAVGLNTHCPGTTFDYNCYYAGRFRYDAGSGYTDYTMAQWRSLGFDIHGLGLSANPLFVSSSNYNLQASSPCRNAGGVITGFNDSTGPYAYEGSAPDIGAYEYSEVTPSPTPTPTPTPTQTPTPTPTPSPAYIPGDANGDGVVNSLDLTKVKRIIMELDNPTPGADANGDGVINAIDITRIEQIILGQ